MRCISPFDSGSYHMGTIRTNRTNRQLGEGFLGLHRVRNILSPPDEIQFSIRQRVVPHGHDLYESTATAQPFYDSYLFRCIGQPSPKRLPFTDRPCFCDVFSRLFRASANIVTGVTFIEFLEISLGESVCLLPL